jgi:hypothetical protein
MIGGIVGGIVAIAAALLAFFLLKHKKNGEPADFDDGEPMESTENDSTYDADEAVFVSEYGLSERDQESFE